MIYYCLLCVCVCVCAFVLSKIDYCNSLHTGCPKQLIHKLKKVLNNAVRLICRTPKSDHISPVLHTLHCSPDVTPSA